MLDSNYIVILGYIFLIWYLGLEWNKLVDEVGVIILADVV